MKKPTTLLWLNGVLIGFVDTSTFRLQSSQIAQMQAELRDLIESFVRNLQPVEPVGLRIIIKLCRGTMLGESMRLT
jgi:hypothetical protein